MKAKLSWSFGLLAAIVMLVSGLSLKALSDANDHISGVSARADMAVNVRIAVDRRAIAARNMALVTAPSDFESEKAAEAQAQRDVEQSLRKLNEMIGSATGTTDRARALLSEINQIEAKYTPVANTIVSLASQGKREQAVRAINDECRPLLAALIKATDGYADYTNSSEVELVRDSEARYAEQRNVSIAICLGSVLLAVVAGILITRSLLRALGAEPDALGIVAQRIAAGDLSPVAHANVAPAGSVLASMSHMQTSLVGLIGQVRTAADSITTGSAEIASGNVDLSSRTEQQSASLQETAASMEELTSTVKQNADNAQHASALSANASEVAHEGSAVVTQVVSSRPFRISRSQGWQGAAGRSCFPELPEAILI
ncbi:MCP four helix bundle domain-containing protein [Candidatus Burkholderia verschuerenii]|uniref:MCP four helix bundle domain-containing protein n=1 Tax=Candidatus Burkholderia verschuerenii TaxID=242163 RepID=UPI002FC39BC7